jgi:DNA polymerase-3 subunit epsilon
MREIVLDTETTGLDPADGHRIVEISALELVNTLPTARVFHRYIDPQRPMPPEAEAVHGLGDAFLRGQPLFAEIAAEFLDFVADARLVIHNAAFDMRFLNAELDRAGFPLLAEDRALDTLLLARQRFPGSPASLDALCRRFGIDLARREKHGARVDCELLAEVYLELIGGRQPDFGLAATLPTSGGRAAGLGLAAEAPLPRRPRPLPPRLTEAEKEAHAALIESLGPDALWKTLP